MSNSTNEALRSYVERVENLEEQKQDLADELKELLAEAKSSGFVPTIIKAVIKIRKMKPSVRAEQETMIATYLHALGDAHDMPLFKMVDMERLPSGAGVAAGRGDNPKREVPDVDGDTAEVFGKDAFEDDLPIVANPFPHADARRARWDNGWRNEKRTAQAAKQNEGSVVPFTKMDC